MEKKTKRLYWTTQELADASGTTTGFVRQELGAGRIRGTKHGRSWMIADAEARRWLDSRQ